MKKIIVSWSGGKDSMLALHRLLTQKEYEVEGLFTAFAGDEPVVNLHFVPKTLIEAQARALQQPLYPVLLPQKAPNEEYERQHLELFQRMKEQGVTHVAFGDLFLEPIREYRLQLMEKAGLEAVFPLWGEQTDALVQKFLRLGYQTMLTAVQTDVLPEELAGQVLTKEMLRSFPEGADPAGEHGEYHSFVFDGPLFGQPVPLKVGALKHVDYRPQYDMALAWRELKPLRS